jgi:hypothetical protein
VSLSPRCAAAQPVDIKVVRDPIQPRRFGNCLSFFSTGQFDEEVLQKIPSVRLTLRKTAQVPKKPGRMCVISLFELCVVHVSGLLVGGGVIASAFHDAPDVRFCLKFDEKSLPKGASRVGGRVSLCPNRLARL